MYRLLKWTEDWWQFWIAIIHRISTPPPRPKSPKPKKPPHNPTTHHTLNTTYFLNSFCDAIFFKRRHLSNQISSESLHCLIILLFIGTASTIYNHTIAYALIDLRQPQWIYTIMYFLLGVVSIVQVRFSSPIKPKKPFYLNPCP